MGNYKKKMYYDWQWDNSSEETKITQTLTASAIGSF